MEYEKIFRNSEPFNPVYELAEKIWPIGASKRIVDPGAYFEITHELLHALIETTELTSELKTKRRYRLAAIGTNGEPIMAEDILSHEWIQSSLST